MVKIDRDFIQETIDDMGLILTFDDGESGFLDDEDGLLNLLHESEMADVLQFIEGYDEPYDFPSEGVD